MEPVHDRMLVILKSGNYDKWLDETEQDTKQLHNLFMPYPAEKMNFHPVSTQVNSPANDSSELIEINNS